MSASATSETPLSEDEFEVYGFGRGTKELSAPGAAADPGVAVGEGVRAAGVGCSEDVGAGAGVLTISGGPEKMRCSTTQPHHNVEP